jgi:hypothetical protein
VRRASVRAWRNGLSMPSSLVISKRMEEFETANER